MEQEGRFIFARANEPKHNRTPHVHETMAAVSSSEFGFGGTGSLLWSFARTFDWLWQNSCKLGEKFRLQSLTECTKHGIFGISAPRYEILGGRVPSNITRNYLCSSLFLYISTSGQLAGAHVPQYLDQSACGDPKTCVSATNPAH